MKTSRAGAAGLLMFHAAVLAAVADSPTPAANAAPLQLPGQELTHPAVTVTPDATLLPPVPPEPLYDAAAYDPVANQKLRDTQPKPVFSAKEQAQLMQRQEQEKDWLMVNFQKLQNNAANSALYPELAGNPELAKLAHLSTADKPAGNDPAAVDGANHGMSAATDDDAKKDEDAARSPKDSLKSFFPALGTSAGSSTLKTFATSPFLPVAPGSDPTTVLPDPPPAPPSRDGTTDEMTMMQDPGLTGAHGVSPADSDLTLDKAGPQEPLPDDTSNAKILSLRALPVATAEGFIKKQNDALLAPGQSRTSSSILTPPPQPSLDSQPATPPELPTSLRAHVADPHDFPTR